MRGSIHERKPGVWSVRVDAAPNPITGKRDVIFETVHGTRRQAEKRRAEMVAQYGGQVRVRTGITVSELFDMWAAAPTRAKRPRGATTQYQDRQRFVRHVVPEFGEREINKVTAQQLTDFYERLLVGRNVVGKLGARSVKHIHEILNAMFSWAERRGYVTANPVRKAEAPVIDWQPPKAPRPEDVHALLAHLRDNDTELWLAVRLAATLATRRSELLALRWRHLEEKNASIRIEEGLVSIPGQGRISTDTKTGIAAAATLLIDDELLEALLQMRSEHEEICRDLDTKFSSDSFIFRSDPLGERSWHPDTMSSRLRKARLQVPGAEGINLKALRSFVATELEGDDSDLTTAQAVLRHRSSTTTAKYYRAARDERVRAATRGLGNRLAHTSKKAKSKSSAKKVAPTRSPRKKAR